MKSSELPKSYDPNIEEPKVRERWLEKNPFHVDPEAEGEPYAIVIPPPNVTAALHLGHALNNTLQDILIRYHRMKGDKTLWMPGTDHAGIATQTVVDKRLQAMGEPAIKDYKLMEAEGRDGRSKFIAKVQAWKDEYEADITAQLKLMGCSCDWQRQRFTMDEVCARAVREAFFQLFKDGLIYRGKRLVNWDPATQTALADDEVENEDIDGFFWYMKYPIVDEHGNDTGEYATVATTRPETMLGDTAVAVNPHDEKHQSLIGKRVRLPIVNRIIEIIGDDYVVVPDGESADAKAQYASGFLKVTPAHDPNDWEIGKRHGLDVINIFAPDATISREHGWREIENELQGDEILDNLIGMDRYEAREAIVEWFRRNDLLAEVRPYRHAVGHSYRSHVAIEPYLSDQWYVRVTDDRLRGAALRALAVEQRMPSEWYDSRESSGTGEEEKWRGGLRFYPERYAKTFQNWHENLRDWCISRQLWWGHRIPVWRTKGDLDQPDTNTLIFKIGAVGLYKNPNVCVRAYNICTGELHEIVQDGQRLDKEQRWQVFVCVLHNDPETITQIENISEVESQKLTQDPDVLDTWFSSALWPMSTMGWPDPSAFAKEFPEGDALLKAFNPSNVLCTAREIITLWVSRMVMFNTYFRNCLPFTDVFIHAMIQDGEGRKMSKSLGNGVDPRDIIKTKGTDAMRFTLALMTTQTQDVRMPVEFDEAIGANTSPKFEAGKRLCNKLWNATRFALGTFSRIEGTGEPNQLPKRLIDRWILSRLAVSLRECEEAIENYQFNQYAQVFYDFFRRDFCDWYLEGIKGTIDDDGAQQSVLRAVLGVVHRMAHPIMPFITETLHETIEGIAVEPLDAIELSKSELAATAPWPVVHDDSLIDNECEEAFERVRTLVSAVREVRSQHQVPDRRKISLYIADDSVMDEIKRAEGIVETLAGLGCVTREKPDERLYSVNVEGREHGLFDLTEEVDHEAEHARLSKRLTELTKAVDNFKGRLSNKKYVDKAPAHLVEETRAQLAEAEAELAAVRESLLQIKS